MHVSGKQFVREVGTAIAVLAIYVLTLLLPLHQATGLQRDLAKLGYEATSTWSICAPLQDENGNNADASKIKCPAAGIAKDFLAGVDLVAAPLQPRLLLTSGSKQHSEAVFVRNLSRHSLVPRGPPAAV